MNLHTSSIPPYHIQIYFPIVVIEALASDISSFDSIIREFKIELAEVF